MRTIALLLFALALPASAEDLWTAVGIKGPTKMTLCFSPKGWISAVGRTTVAVNDAKVIAAVVARLKRFPAKGGSNKLFSKTIPHWIMTLEGEGTRQVKFDIYGVSLQSPVDRTFSAADGDPGNRKLMALLGTALRKAAKDLTTAAGIVSPTRMTVVHSPKGYKDATGQQTVKITDTIKIDAVVARLRHFPARGGANKDWPPTIPHWRLTFERDGVPTVTINIYGHSVQSPVDKGFSGLDHDPGNVKLMTLLNAALKKAKR